MPGDVTTAELPLRSYMNVLWRRKWIIAVVIAVVTGAAIGASLLQTPKYTATALIKIQPTNTPVPLSPNSGATESTLGTADVITEQSLVTSTAVKNAVRTQLGSAPQVTASQVGQTNLISVEATSTDPRFAARVANSYAGAFVDTQRSQVTNDLSAAAAQIQAKITQLDQQIAAAGQNSGAAAALSTQEANFRAELAQLQVNSSLSSGGAQVASQAVVPSSPSSPRTVRNALIGFGLGLIAGIGLAFLIDRLDDSIRSREDLDRVSSDLPTIGTVPYASSWRKTKVAWLASEAAPTSASAEAYRTLRTSLRFVSLERSIRTVLVTSPSESEGKTTTLANLAVSLAQAGQRVAVVSCDLRRPRLHSFFGLSNDVGFTSVLVGETDLSGALQTVGSHGPVVLPSGPVPPNPAELLASDRTVELFGHLKDQFDTILVDSPPVLPVADAVILAEHVDATLVVVAAGETSRKELTRSLEILRQVRAYVAGFILNEVATRAGYGYPDNYSYRSTYSSNGAVDLARVAENDGAMSRSRD